LCAQREEITADILLYVRHERALGLHTEVFDSSPGKPSGAHIVEESALGRKELTCIKDFTRVESDTCLWTNKC